MSSRKNSFSMEACYRKAGHRHWSRVFYDNARGKGFLFAARPHAPNYVSGFGSDDDLQAFNEMDHLYELPYVKRCQDDRFDHWVLTPYTDDGECLLSAYLKNGEHWVAAYFMPLTATTLIEGETTNV